MKNEIEEELRRKAQGCVESGRKMAEELKYHEEMAASARATMLRMAERGEEYLRLLAIYQAAR